MIQHVKDDLYQIGEHVQNEYGFEAILTYVLLNEGNPILIDCGSHIHRESVMAQLSELLGNTTPEYLFLTHSELPHAGNIAAVAELLVWGAALLLLLLLCLAVYQFCGKCW